MFSLSFLDDSTRLIDGTIEIEDNRSVLCYPYFQIHSYYDRLLW